MSRDIFHLWPRGSAWHRKDSELFSSQDISPCVFGSFWLQPNLPPAWPPAMHSNKLHSPLSHLQVSRGSSLGKGRVRNLCLSTAEWQESQQKNLCRGTNKAAARNPSLMLIYYSSPTRKADVRQPKSIPGSQSHLLKPWFSMQKVEMILRSRGCKEN